MSLAQQEVDSAARYSPDQLDRELRSRVAEYLFDRNEHAFRSLHVEADHGTVTLTGLVRSYYEKQVAASCLNVSGVLNLINNLTVPEWETDDDEFPTQQEHLFGFLLTAVEPVQVSLIDHLY